MQRHLESQTPKITSLDLRFRDTIFSSGWVSEAVKPRLHAKRIRNKRVSKHHTFMFASENIRKYLLWAVNKAVVQRTISIKQQHHQVFHQQSSSQVFKSRNRGEARALHREGRKEADDPRQLHHQYDPCAVSPRPRPLHPSLLKITVYHHQCPFQQPREQSRPRQP